MSEKRGMKALELWCRRVTEGYPGVKIENMTTSWRDGLAFCALIHHFRPDLIDFDRLDKRDIYKNNELAFRIAERQLGIPALLDAEDMVEYEVPDRLSILTYLSQFYQAFVSNQQGTASPSPRKHTSAVSEILSSGPKNPSSKVGPGRLETCWSCRRPVFLAERLVAGGKLRHRTCFTCKRCGQQLNLVGSYETEEGDFVCETCPDEEKSPRDREEAARLREEADSGAGQRDEYSLTFEEALDSLVQSRADDVKSKFLSDLIADTAERVGATCEHGAGGSERSEAEDADAGKTADPGTDQTLTSEMEGKLKTLREITYGDVVDIDESVDDIKKEVSLIIDKIIEEAIERLDKSGADGKEDGGEIKAPDAIGEEPARAEEVAEKPAETAKQESGDVKTEKPKGEDDYPEDLNPFGDDDDDDDGEVVELRKPPVPASRKRSTGRTPHTKDGQKIIEAPAVHLNPFWSDGEPTSEDESSKPVPAPRTSLRLQDGSKFGGSNTSLNSLSSSMSTSRRKKGPAPRPPSERASVRSPPSPTSNYSTPSSYDSRSPVSTYRSHRKSKPAPPPPPLRETAAAEVSAEKKEKNYENKMKQNLTAPDKSTYGKWKRKKGQAPSLPIPQRRRITPLPLPDLYRELEDLEVQQRELERQGVNIEQAIRQYEAEESEKEETEKEKGGEQKKEEAGKDVEGLILQLFEIVNQKNELFRRQAELMYLRRQQRLEEEHADIEYQIRCLMGRPERNKTDSDKAQEEELIRRLVDVVERRNEIIECLDMDRKREVEEDRSIHHHLEAYAGKATPEEPVKIPHKSPATLLKLIKKKKLKKDKRKDSPSKPRRDADKDIDESVKEEETKQTKTKKKWFKT